MSLSMTRRRSACLPAGLHAHTPSLSLLCRPSDAVSRPPSALFTPRPPMPSARCAAPSACAVLPYSRHWGRFAIPLSACRTAPLNAPPHPFRTPWGCFVPHRAVSCPTAVPTPSLRLARHRCRLPLVRAVSLPPASSPAPARCITPAHAVSRLALCRPHVPLHRPCCMLSRCHQPQHQCRTSAAFAPRRPPLRALALSSRAATTSRRPCPRVPSCRRHPPSLATVPSCCATHPSGAVSPSHAVATPGAACPTDALSAAPHPTNTVSTAALRPSDASPHPSDAAASPL
ncbi:hypothetical protein DENSPDRAFT_929264 [Dentipellis sp. KUC8613]|nr:hypothetical protein DENSPDRAFT_929264 [Dentipellis sp. KUC8613]